MHEGRRQPQAAQGGRVQVRTVGPAGAGQACGVEEFVGASPGRQAGEPVGGGHRPQHLGRAHPAPRRGDRRHVAERRAGPGGRGDRVVPGEAQAAARRREPGRQQAHQRVDPAAGAAGEGRHGARREPQLDALQSRVGVRGPGDPLEFDAVAGRGDRQIAPHRPTSLPPSRPDPASDLRPAPSPTRRPVCATGVLAGGRDSLAPRASPRPGSHRQTVPRFERRGDRSVTGLDFRARSVPEIQRSVS